MKTTDYFKAIIEAARRLEIASDNKKNRIEYIIELALNGQHDPMTVHADEMLKALKELHGQLSGRLTPVTPLHLRKLGELLDKIEPPKPPTVDELAIALHDLLNRKTGDAGPIGSARSLLDRMSKKADEFKKGMDPIPMAPPHAPEAAPFYLKPPSTHGPCVQGCIEEKSVSNYAEMRNVGWTDTLLRDHGYMK